MPDLERGESTEVHDLYAPEMYEDFDEQFRALLEAVDAGIVIVEESETALKDEYEGGNHSGVLGLVADEEDPAFYVSENGAFGEPITIDIDISDLDDEEVSDLVTQLEDDYLSTSGGEVDGDITMTGDAALDASDGNVILPTY